MMERSIYKKYGLSISKQNVLTIHSPSNIVLNLKESRQKHLKVKATVNQGLFNINRTMTINCLKKISILSMNNFLSFWKVNFSCTNSNDSSIEIPDLSRAQWSSSPVPRRIPVKYCSRLIFRLQTKWSGYPVGTIFAKFLNSGKYPFLETKSPISSHGHVIYSDQRGLKK